MATVFPTLVRSIGHLGCKQRAIPVSKRMFDLGVVLCLAPLAVPLGLVLCCAILLFEGRPVFYVARRAGQNGRPFGVLKFRTMRTVGAQDMGVTGGDKSARISQFSRWIRMRRLDELPQLINVLLGHMSLVGPRPPDLNHVEKFPDVFRQVLVSRPGMTGLATLHMHRFEDRFLKKFHTAEETENAYCRICIPRKARLDLIYRRRWHAAGGVMFDSSLLIQSLTAVLRK